MCVYVCVCVELCLTSSKRTNASSVDNTAIEKQTMLTYIFYICSLIVFIYCIGYQYSAIFSVVVVAAVVAVVAHQ